MSKRSLASKTGCLALLFGISFGFQLPPRIVRPCTTSSGVSSLRATAGSTVDDVELVNVCMGELCQCQGAEVVLEKLRADLPGVEVEETICMGACGPEAMVAIDFKDGRSYLVEGLDETLMELDITAHDEPVTAASSVIAEEIVLGVESSVRKEKVPEVTTTAAQESDDLGKVLNAFQTTAAVSEPVPKPSTELTDVRERMRKEAEQEGPPQENPWGMAVSYLAQKAKEKMFG